MLLGHSPAAVVEAVRDQVGRAILCAAQSEVEYRAAELVCEMVPCAEVVRFGSSGSEMVQAALRLARAATGRRAIVKFEGHYHGWFDNVLWSHAPALSDAGAAARPTAVAGSAGQEAEAGDGLVVLPWNDADAVRSRLAAGDIAAVIMEPVMCNTSAIWPAEGYLEAVRAACDEHGTLLIFDEVITGFRLAPGGAQEVLGVTPDLAVFGKAIANGFPVACLAGSRQLLERFGAAGAVMHAGTYNGQPVGMAATVAALETMRSGGVHERLATAGASLMQGITSVLAARGIAATVQGHPSIFHVALGIDHPIRNYRDAATSDKAAYVRLTTALLQRGVRALERGAWFMSTAHSDDDIAATVAAFDDSLGG
jgi:glutamate-1-semialdehyde 2,1-aminomutase